MAIVHYIQIYVVGISRVYYLFYFGANNLILGPTSKPRVLSPSKYVSPIKLHPLQTQSLCVSVMMQLTQRILNCVNVNKYKLRNVSWWKFTTPNQFPRDTFVLNTHDAFN